MATTNELEKLSIKLNTAVATVLSISNMIQAELLRIREAGEEVPQNLAPVTDSFVEPPVLLAPAAVAGAVSDEAPASLATPSAKRTRRSHAEVVAAATVKQPHTDGRSARWAAHRAQIVADIDAGLRSRPINWTEEDLVRYRAEAAALVSPASEAIPAPAPVEISVPDNGLLTPVSEETPVPASFESEPENPDIERIVDQF